MSALFLPVSSRKHAVAWVIAMFLVSGVSAAEVHPIEGELRRSFPTVAIQSTARFEPVDMLVRGALASGLRPRFAGRNAVPSGTPNPQSWGWSEELEVLYPRSYDGLIVVESGAQRLVLRATGASAAQAVEADGKLVYSRPYASTDAVELPKGGRSEELLLLHDERAPRTFDYEIVDTVGVAAVAISDGAVRFLPTLVPSEVATGRFTRREPSLQIDRPWLIDAGGKRSERQATWTLIGDGAMPTGIRLTVILDRLAFPVVIDPTFSVTGNLGIARYNHTATLLPNGKVLVAGGVNGGVLTSAELYDPTNGTFTATGSLIAGRSQHTATLLPNGKVLIAGGSNGSIYMTTAELYDPATGTFSTTGSLASGHQSATATLLPSGKVLIAGGYNGAYTTAAELYDPTNGTFTATGSLATARGFHTASLLRNGKVLIAGGAGASGQVASAELYDPAGNGGAGTFSPTGSMSAARGNQTATLLPNGMVLIAGGRNLSVYLSSAELYDPAGNSGAGTFTATAALGTARALHTATLLPNGTVLVVGGQSTGGVYVASAEIFDPATGINGTFSATSSLAALRGSHTATLIPNGTVLIAGGYNGSASMTSVEVYDPTSATFTATGDLGGARAQSKATQLPNGKVLIAGGNSGGTNYLASAELYDFANGTFAGTGSLGTARQGSTTTVLANGKVLIAGGYNGTNLASAELYDPASGTFTPTGSLVTGRSNHAASLLPNGRVLIVSGAGPTGYLASAELYDPAGNGGAGTFTATGSLGTARGGHTATLLPNGKVLIAGGQNLAAYQVSAELYDVSSGTFSATGSLGTARSGHTATLLADGKVLIAAGRGTGGVDLGTAEIFDPSAGTNGAFSPTGSLASVRSQHTATLLPNGKVLIAGGIGPGYLSSAELYDSTTRTFTATSSLGIARAQHTSTLLPNGKVLIAGGIGAPGFLTSAELYDIGNGSADARRPVITSAPASLAIPSTLTIVGSGFRGDSEGSTGGTTNSATNFPIVQLERVDNEQSFFVPSSASFADVSWAGSLNGLAPGWYRATVFTNAIPSIQQLILITTATPTIATVSPNRGLASGGQSVTISGTNLGGVAVTIGGNSATVTGTTATSATFITPAHSPGTVDVTVTTTSAVSATAAGSYTYVANPPTNVVALAQSTTSVRVSWTAAPGATAYDVLRSTDGVNYSPLATISGTLYTDLLASPATSYLYAVRASAPDMSDNSLPDLATTVIFTDPTIIAGTTLVKAIHFTELRAAVNAVRQLAAQAAGTYTDPTVTAATLVKAAHVTDLRTALNEARSALSLLAISYSRATLTPGLSVISASDINELRNGTQ